MNEKKGGTIVTYVQCFTVLKYLSLYLKMLWDRVCYFTFFADVGMEAHLLTCLSHPGDWSETRCVEKREDIDEEVLNLGRRGH